MRIFDKCTTLRPGTLLVVRSCGKGPVWTKSEDDKTDSCLYVPAPVVGSTALFLAEEMKIEGNQVIPHLKLLVDEKVIYVPYEAIQYSILVDTQHIGQ